MVRQRFQISIIIVPSVLLKMNDGPFLLVFILHTGKYK